MYIEDQVCSLGLSKHISDLGINKKSEYYWIISDNKLAIFSRDRLISSHDMVRDDIINIIKDRNCEIISAYTASELSEMIPPYYVNDIRIVKVDDRKWLAHIDSKILWESETLVEIMGRVLSYLIKNGYMIKIYERGF